MKTSIPFTKIQATGNDFVVINNMDGQFTMDQMIHLTPGLCDRKFGVGADGCLFLCAYSSHDFEMIYRNADGSDAGMCGNGGRAICLFAHRLGLGNSFTFTVHGVSYSGQMITDSVISLGFNELKCSPTRLAGDEPQFFVYTGTDHLVVPVSQDALRDLDFLHKQGRTLRYDPRFLPKGTNVNFCCFTSTEEIEICTYERGVEALTLACGTGSIACSIVEHYLRHSHLRHPDPRHLNPSHLNPKHPDSGKDHASYRVINPGGSLDVRFDRDPIDHQYHHIFLTGEAVVTFTGLWDA